MACSTHVTVMKCITIFVGKPERKRPLEIPRRSREDNIRMDLGEIWWEVVDPSGSG